MPVIIQPMGQLKSYFINHSEITVEAGQTVRETLVRLQIKPEAIVSVIVNVFCNRKTIPFRKKTH